MQVYFIGGSRGGLVDHIPDRYLGECIMLPYRNSFFINNFNPFSSAICEEKYENYEKYYISNYVYYFENQHQGKSYQNVEPFQIFFAVKFHEMIDIVKKKMCEFTVKDNTVALDVLRKYF